MHWLQIDFAKQKGLPGAQGRNGEVGSNAAARAFNVDLKTIRRWRRQEASLRTQDVSATRVLTAKPLPGVTPELSEREREREVNLTKRSSVHA
jgi:hypothetical protein